VDAEAGKDAGTTLTSTGKKDDWWLLELATVAISALGIAGMAILLWEFNGQPEPT